MANDLNESEERIKTREDFNTYDEYENYMLSEHPELYGDYGDEFDEKDNGEYDKDSYRTPIIVIIAILLVSILFGTLAYIDYTFKDTINIVAILITIITLILVGVSIYDRIFSITEKKVLTIVKVSSYKGSSTTLILVDENNKRYWCDNCSINKNEEVKLITAICRGNSVCKILK